MPQYKRVKSLETLSMLALTNFTFRCTEDLLPMYTEAFELILPDLHSNEIGVNDDEFALSEFLEDEIDSLEDLEAICKMKTKSRRRKSSGRSMEDFQRSTFTQKQIAEILRQRIQIVHNLFEYNIPCYLFDRIRQHLQHEIPHLVDQIKTRRTIKTSQSEYMAQCNAAVSLLEVVIGPYLTYCNFEETPKMLQHVLYMRLKEMKGLEFLNLGSLTGGWKVDEMEPTILSGIEVMKNLRYLCLNYDCTDAILLKLIETCPHLQSLDLTSSKSITDDSVNLLTRMNSLRSVQLYRTSVTIEGYVKLFLKLKNLEDIGQFSEIGHCLEYIVDKYPDFQKFSLRKFNSRFVTTRFLQILSEYCPKMQYVSIFFNMLICDLTTLIGINQLSHLQLMSCDFFSDQIRDVLAVKGCNLTLLHLEHVDQIDMNALMYISQYCPDLKVLTIYNCELIESTSLYLQKPTIPPFMNLERMTLIAQCDHRHLEFLWSTCLHIKSIKCGMMVPTNDHIFEKILSHNPMEHLEELSIVRSDGLTIKMAYKLVEICTNLTQLNELEGWSRIKEEEIQMFKTFIKMNNLDLNLESRRFQTTTEELL